MATHDISHRKTQVERILRNTKLSMQVEGFNIDAELEAKGRKLLLGELDINDYLEECRKEARSIANEI